MDPFFVVLFYLFVGFHWTVTQGFLHFCVNWWDLVFDLVCQFVHHCICLFIAFVVLEVVLSYIDHFIWKFQYFHNLNAITFLHLAFFHLVLQHQKSIFNSASGEHVFNSFDLRCHSCHLMEVRCKKAVRIDLCVKILTDGPSYPIAFACTGSSSQLIDQNKWIFSCCFEHAWTLEHFTHESWDTFDLHIWSSNSCYNCIYDGKLELQGGHVET